ncbi:MAG: hypothetical protein JNK76_13445 [Planctomycetales bacterium]|nr:hypothetical protein [Planctomycetales bacterium]MBN8624384.1 hypothetical protein [Planctomycetota bacterium]
MIQLTINLFTPLQACESRAGLTPDTACEAVQRASHSDFAFVFASDPENTAAVDLLCWFAGDRARLRLDFHREFYAADPNLRSTVLQEPVTFCDEYGEKFTTPYSDTISKRQAIEAFEHWARIGGADLSLSWQ